MAFRRTIPDDRDGKYWYDAKAAKKAVAFFPRYLRLFEGEWAGEPLVLMEWVAEIVRDVWGWKRQDGTRRYRTLYIWIPRKNAKSTVAAGLGLLLLLGDGEPGGQVFTIASNEDQAKIVFNFAANMVNLSPDLTKIIVPFKTALYCSALNASMRWLTGKAQGKHGLNASGIIGDEIHEWPSDDLYTFVHQSEGTRRQPLDVLISTAGKRGGVGWEHYQLSEAILNGEIDAEDVYVYIAAADPKRDADEPMYWATEEAVRESNPSLGQTVKLEFLLAEIEKAKSNPRKINDIKRYYLNLWVDQATVWLQMDKYDKCATDLLGTNGEETLGGHATIKREDMPIIYRVPSISYNNRWSHFRRMLAGRRCVVGIDLASTTDLACASFVFPPLEPGDPWFVIPRFFIPRGDDTALAERTKKDKFDYQAAADIGALVLTDGEVTDYDAIFKEVMQFAEEFAIEKVGIDRWNATQIATQLSEAGLEVELFGQGFASMTGPTKHLERIILQKRLDHGGHPVLRWNARNVAVKKDGADNMKPVKDESHNRIDGIVATIIAIGMSDDFLLDTTSVYENRGVIRLG